MRVRLHLDANLLILLGFLAGVTGLTLAQRAGAFAVSAVAASPEGVSDGRLWSVLTSAPVAQTPVWLSLLSFAALAVGVSRACGSKVLWLSAVIGHAGSTLLIYLAIGLFALVDQHLVTNLLNEQDYGVSAIFSAWLGAIAARCWMRRRGAWMEKLTLALSCLGVALVAWLVRGEPTPSVLDSEHLVAFVIGAAIAVASMPRDRQKTSHDDERDRATALQAW
jgi:membrane associated rhomboid family serine protease